MKKYLILLLISILSGLATGAGKLTVYFDQNGVERSLAWQCHEIDECFEMLENRIEEKGGCDPRVRKVVVERVFIEGLD